jgi:hypothetical protein
MTSPCSISAPPCARNLLETFVLDARAQVW